MKYSFATPSRTLFALPYWIAEGMGYFADEGIDPRLAFVPDSGRAKAGLRSGDFLMSIDPPDGVITDAADGGPLRILGGNARRPPLYLIAQPEIRQLSDLRGKVFGVLSLKEGSSKFIRKIAAAGGLSPDDYKVVAVGGAPARARMLADRTIDVGLQPLPLNYEAEDAGFSNLGWTGEYEPHYQFTTVNADIGHVGHDRPGTVAALRALLRGQRFAFANPEQAAPLLAERLATNPDHALRAIREAARLEILDGELNFSELALGRIVQNLRDDGLLAAAAHFRSESYVAPDFLSTARSSLDASSGALSS